MKQKPLLELLEEVKQAYLAINHNAIYLYKYQSEAYLLKYTDAYNQSLYFTWAVIASNNTSPRTNSHIRLPHTSELSLVPPEDYPLYLTWNILDTSFFITGDTPHEQT